MARLALLCPGQGGQSTQMLALAQSDTAARHWLQQLEADGAVQPAALDAQALFDNRLAQPLIVTATLANWLALRTLLPSPALLAGYSIGEWSAHAIGGTLTPDAAVQLARQRAQAMQDCVLPGVPHRMLAISGMLTVQVQEFCARHQLQVAIITGPDAAIIAGVASRVADAAKILQAMPRCHLTELPVHIASHTTLMTAAVAVIRAALDAVPLSAPALPVLAGVDGSVCHTPQQSMQALLAQTTQTIRWDWCMESLNEAGITIALELGPGNALSKMLQARYPHIACRSVADFRHLDAVADWVSRQS